MGRDYLDRDLKILFGAHAMCAFPGCRRRLIEPATADDPITVTAKICHIVAHSDEGPRGDPDFPPEDREKADNLILMCGVHHDIIDGQPNTHTIADLRRWRAEHNQWVETTLTDAVVALTFAELDQAAQALVSLPPGPPGSLAPPTPPGRKMAHNGLTPAVAHYYVHGQLRFDDIERYVAEAHVWDDAFGDRLIAGFKAQYDELWSRGLRGDDLYISLATWASGGSQADFLRTAAGIAIVSYLFSTCDVFERAPEPDAAAD